MPSADSLACILHGYEDERLVMRQPHCSTFYSTSATPVFLLIVVFATIVPSHRLAGGESPAESIRVTTDQTSTDEEQVSVDQADDDGPPRQESAGEATTGNATTGKADESPQAKPSRIETPEVTSTDQSTNWVQHLVEQSEPSIALITVHGRGGRQIGLGTGFVISSDGLLATNLHVIGEARPIKVRFASGDEYSVTEVFASDRLLDLAIVRIDAPDLKPLQLGANLPPNVGEPLIALGNPMGLRNSVVSGVVSGVRKLEGREMIQVAMPIEPGNSGGPLLDRNGRVLGVVTMKSAVTANLGFAVTVSSLRRLMENPNPVAIARWKTIGSLDPQRWETLFGANWRRQAGVISVEGSGSGFGGRSLCLAKTTLPESPIEVASFVKLDDESGAAGLAFGADGHNRHYGFYASGGRLRLTHFEGPSVYSWRVIRELPSSTYERGEWNHLKVRITGKQVECFVNDEKLLAVDLPTAPRGRAGLAKFRDTVAQFKGFAVAPQIARVRPTDESLTKVRAKLEELTNGVQVQSEQLDALAADADASQYAIRVRAQELENELAQLKRLGKDVHIRNVTLALKSELTQDETDINLARAALLIARLDNPDLDVNAYLKQVDEMASQIETDLAANASVKQRIDALHQFLFDANGYHGSRTNYYHAANSYFDRVLDDREGLPITLAVLYLELARRIDLNAEGIGMPGHFLVGVRNTQTPTQASGGAPQGSSENRDAATTFQLIDVFDRGTELSLAEAQELCEGITGRSFEPSFLAPVSKRAIAQRILQNLLGIAQRERDSERLLGYLTAMIELSDDDPSLRGMRAVIRHETGRKQEALDDLDWIIEHASDEMNIRAIHDLRRRFEQ